MKTYSVKETQRTSKAFTSVHCETAISLLLDVPSERVKVKQTRLVTKSTFEQTNEINLDGELKVIIHVDVPILIKLDWPCPYVEVWRRRQRLWPDLNLLSKELNISYLIAKTSRKEKTNRNTTEFKYSFTHIEHKIMSLLSQNQRTVFYTAKTMFKHWIKPYSDVYFPSFLVKNTMFWICEQSPPDDHLWHFESDEDFLSALRYFFTRLMGYLRSGFLPYYFITEVNLIEGIPEHVSRDALTTLERLTVDVRNHLPDDESKDVVESWLESMSVVLYRVMDLIEAANSFGPYVALLTLCKNAIMSLTEEQRDSISHIIRE